jgi:glucosamine--fructose-6-phosphate aminotransferase (isomerizing)
MREALRGRLGADGGAFELPEMAALAEIAVPPSRPGWPRRVCLVACGTAYNAGLLARGWLEGLARIDSSADIASEFRYRRPLLDAQDLLVAISQSGETADTLGALREGRRSGAAVLGVVNVVGSSVARESDAVLYTRAGPEIAVASTKAYVTQLVVLGLITLELARRAERLPEAALFEAVEALRALPGLAQRSLELVPQVEEFAAELAGAHDVFYIGRGLDFPVCLEAQLKLKELSYLHAEAYPAGELKHGTLALIEEGVPVIAVITQPGLCEKTLSNVREVEARGGRVTAVVSENLAPAVAPHVARVLAVPATLPWLAPMLAIIPLQLLAYHVARLRGCDVDKPRNLAKSVTVE